MNQSIIYTLYEQYKNGIFRYALSITKDPCLAEDVLQNTFVKMLSGGIRCSSGKEQAWLYRVARNLCYDYLRKTKREQPYEEAPICSENKFEYWINDYSVVSDGGNCIWRNTDMVQHPTKLRLDSKSQFKR